MTGNIMPQEFHLVFLNLVFTYTSEEPVYNTWFFRDAMKC